MATTGESPSRDLTFEWGRTAPDELAKIGDSIDMKAVGVFAAASLIVGVAATRIDAIDLDWTLTPLVVAAASYLGVLLLSWLVLLPKEFAGPDDPSILRESYWGMNREEAQVQYWRFVESAYRDTYKKIRVKGLCLRIAVVGLGIEVLALTTWLVLLAVL